MSRDRFVGFLWRRNACGSGSGVLSALRLHPLLRPFRLYLYSAAPFRLPALWTVRKLCSANGVLDIRLSQRNDHGAISTSDVAPAAVSFSPRCAAPTSPAALREHAQPMGIPMRLRALLLLLGTAALFGATPVTSAPASSTYPWCADDRATLDSCYYYVDGRRCWVTMSGLGVCAPVPPAPSRQRRGVTARRY